jgi:Uma2 family endonuclease
LYINEQNEVSTDIAIHTLLSPDKITTKYADYPPKLVVEIDIDIDPASMPEIEYLQKKTAKMLEFGVERVIWILTYVRKVIVADRLNDTWLMVDWASDIELMEGITFNIQQFLNKRGINPDSIQKEK